MSRIRRMRPSTEEDRKLASELLRTLKSDRTSKAERAAAQAKYDLLCPPVGSGSPNEIRVSKPGTKDLLNLCDRVEARRADGPVSEKRSVEEALARLAVEDRARAIRRAENATPLEKAQTLISEMPGHPLQKLARETAEWLWREDLSNPKPDVDALTAHRVRHWLSDAPYNRHDVRSNRETVDAAVADVYRLVAMRDEAQPGWYVRLAEKRWDAPALAQIKTQRAPEPQTFSASQ